MAFDALVSNQVGSNIPPSLLPPLDESDPSRIGTNVPPPQMIYGQPTNYPNRDFSPLADLSTFSMDPLGVLQFSQSIDSVSGNSESVSAGPAGPQVASTSKSTVKKSRRLRVGKAKTARYVSQNLYD